MGGCREEGGAGCTREHKNWLSISPDPSDPFTASQSETPQCIVTRYFSVCLEKLIITMPSAADVQEV